MRKMLIITIRTDNPQAEIGLYENGKQVNYITWQAHRELAETIHKKIHDLLKGSKKELKDISGIAVNKGPGSFTGLRIGLSVANALSYGLKGIPIISESGENWIDKSLSRLDKGENEVLALPNYGALPHITKPKH